MSSYSVPFPNQRIPCAMQHYLRQMDPGAPSYDLSRSQCQLAFQHWVAYIRSGNDACPSNHTTTEHLRCPLLWCREPFDNLASTLHHVSECPWLSNTWYWCPYCCRPESFMASKEPCAQTTDHNIQRKDSKLRRAVTFFKHLGLKSGSRHKSLASPLAYHTDSLNISCAIPPLSEMEDTSHMIPKSAELADSSKNTKIQTEPVHEMESNRFHILQDLNYVRPYMQDAYSGSHTCELDAEPQAMVPQLIGETRNSAIPFTGIGAQFEGTPHVVEPMREMLASSNASFGNRQTAESITTPFAEVASAGHARHRPDATTSYQINDPQQCFNTVAPIPKTIPRESEKGGKICDGVISSTQSQIDDLREMVRVLNEEWVRRGRSIPALSRRVSSLSPRTLLDKGAQTLQLIFQDVLPATFDAVFALAHLACAAAYIMHRDDESHCRDGLFQQMLDLQNLIQDGSDKQLLRQLVDLLFWPQSSSTKPLSGNDFLDESSGKFAPLQRSAPSFDGLSSIETTNMQAPRPPMEPAVMANLRQLKDLGLFHECSRFLDGLEYAGIVERTERYPTHIPWYAQNHVTNIEELLKTIIYPLQQCDGIEALHDAINFTAIELKNGSLRSVREVEVSLISNGKSSSLSPKVYKRYLDNVTSICDQVMHEAGPSWRDRYYVTDLDALLASIVEVDNRRHRDHVVSRRRHSANVNATPNNTQKSPETNPPPHPYQPQTPTTASLSAHTSPTFTGGYSTAAQPDSTTTPGSSFSAPTPSPSSQEATHCPYCPRSFTGSSRDRRSNLRRHMRTTRDHGYVVGLRCTVAGCDRTLSRTDNLGKHLRTVHGGESEGGVRRAGAVKRRRRMTGEDE